MCHDIDSRPPAPPHPQTVASSGAFHLSSADGTTFPAFSAEPTAPNGASVALLPDARGAHPFYRDLAVRFAEAGFPTVAIDYYGRTAESDDRGAGFDFAAHLPRVRPRDVAADVRVATPQSELDALATELAAAGVEAEVHVYAGAPHSFFDRSHAEWTDACSDAWQRILTFTTRHKAGGKA